MVSSYMNRRSNHLIGGKHGGGIRASGTEGEGKIRFAARLNAGNG